MQDEDNLAGALFALITAKFEDGAGLALDGQRYGSQDLDDIVAHLTTMTAEIRILLHAVRVISSAGH